MILSSGFYGNNKTAKAGTQNPSLYPDEFFEQVVRRSDAERDRPAADAVLPIVSVRVPGLRGDDAAGVRADQAGHPDHAFSARVASGYRRQQGVLYLRAR